MGVRRTTSDGEAVVLLVSAVWAAGTVGVISTETDRTGAADRAANEGA
jgi:hypothetical protein